MSIITENNTSLALSQSETIKKQCRHWFLLLIFCQLLCWTLAPTLLLDNTYVDILENIVWGKHFAWGYDKDPFLGGWITYFAYHVSGNQIWPAYLLSQLSVVICFTAVWQLAKRILPPIHAIIAVSLLVGILYFSHLSPEFNDDILELPLWSLTVLFFYDAISKQSLYAWIATGIFAALALMAKYYTGMLLLSMFLFTLYNVNARRSYTRPGIYGCLFIFICLVAPNIIWLVQHHFISLHYAFNRAEVSNGTSETLLSHFTHPLSFLFSMAGVVAPLLAISFICFKKQRAFHLNTFDKQFLIALCFGPLLLTLIFSFMTGGRLHYTWATPLFNLFGICLIAWINPPFNYRNVRNYILLTSLLFMTGLIMFLWTTLLTPYLTKRGGHETYPGKHIAKQLTNEWHAHYQTPLAFVSGPRELTLNVSVYSKDHPEPFFDWNTNTSPWINYSQLYHQGMILMWPILSDDLNQVPAVILQLFQHAEFVHIEESPWAVRHFAERRLHFQKIPPVKLLIGFIPPSSRR